MRPEAAPAQARYRPANAKPSVRRTVTAAGFPPSAWAFALRTWAAMMVALYAAFWLPLESASPAAVTVGILALQTRELFPIGFAGWQGLCVYVGGLLDGNRAYGAVLSGYPPHQQPGRWSCLV